MKNFKFIAYAVFSMFSLAFLSSCAAGSATAAYALKAQTADNLSADAEQRIVSRTKNEVLTEMYRQKSCDNSCSSL